MSRTIKQAVASGIAVEQTDMANLKWGTGNLVVPAIAARMGTRTASIAISGLTTDDFAIVSIHTTGTSLDFQIQGSNCNYDGVLDIYFTGLDGTPVTQAGAIVNYIYVKS